VDVRSARGSKTCRHADWRNDEPLMMPAEADCRVQRGPHGRADARCVPATGR